MERIFLVGYMGSGKTTVGKRLAKMLGLHFIDLDLFIENRYRKTVRQIFTEEGEAAFREIEHRALQEVAVFEDVVISTGGGVPCFFDNMDLMNRSGTSVYLKVSIDELTKRLNKCKHSRPLIRDKDPEELKQFIVEMLKRREPFYSRSTLIFDSETLHTKSDIDTIAIQLIQYLHKERIT